MNAPAMSLRRKLLMTFLPVALLPLAITGVLSGILIYHWGSWQATLRLHNQATLTAELVHKELEGRLLQLATIASNPLIVDAIRTSTERAEALNLHRLPISEVEAQFTDSKLVQLNETINNYLRTVAAIGSFAELFVTEQHGFNVAYTQITTDFVQRDELWWQQGKNQGKWIDEPSFDASVNQVTVSLVYAIADPDTGEFLGVLKGGYDTLRLEYLAEELQNLQLIGSEQLQIVAIGNRVTPIATLTAQARMQTQTIWGGEAIAQQAKQLVAAHSNLEDELSKRASVSFTHNNRRYTLTQIPGTNWVAIASINVVQISTANYQLLSMFMLVSLCLAAVATVVILRISRQLTAPLNHLTQAARQATEKADFTVQVPITTQGYEVGVLARSFNQLLQRVQQLLHEQAAVKTNLEDYSHVLEQNVQVRTQELNEKKQCLEQALEELQQTQVKMVHSEKMSSLGRMVAGIAHEINNPVNFIHGNLIHVQDYAYNLLAFIQFFQQHYPNPEPELQAKAQEIDLTFLQEDLLKTLNSMRVGTERIRQIVLSLRNFSRMDESELKTVNIHDGIESTLLILQHHLKLRPGYPAIQITKNYGNLPEIECYAGQLNQVFMNILANAIDALEDVNQESVVTDNPTITICTSMIDSEWVGIAIADNGSGMPEHVKHRIFDPFFTTKPVGKGTGIGMFISYQIIVEQHRGKLECFSTPGKGTEFLIQIPTRQTKRLAL